jgi:hypothetical protein
LSDDQPTESADLLEKYPMSEADSQRHETIEFCFSSGSRCELLYRDLVSIELDAKGVILGFARHTVRLAGARLDSLYEQLRRHSVSTLHEVKDNSELLGTSTDSSRVERIKIEER